MHIDNRMSWINGDPGLTRDFVQLILGQGHHLCHPYPREHEQSDHTESSE
jgi:hypothetical protein